MSEPLVSIVIPTKNRADILPQAIDSVRRQTYRDWECHVVDDGSEDQTREVISRVAREEPRIHYHHRDKKPAGGSACRNQGLEMSRGKYVIFLDSDDLLAPQCLSERVRMMETEPSVDFIIFGIELFRQTPGDLGLAFNTMNGGDDLGRFLNLDAVWQTMGPIWRRDALSRLGPWDESLLSFQDWELHVRALAMGLKYHKVEQHDCHCRIPQSGRETISRHVNSLEHLRSHERLLEKVRAVLKNNSKLSGANAQRIAGLYLWLAQKLQSAGDHPRAAGVWRRCLEHQLINHLTWMEGWMFLESHDAELIRAAARMYLWMRWPAEMARKGSRTFHNFPLRESVVLRPPRKTRFCLYEFPA